MAKKRARLPEIWNCHLFLCVKDCAECFEASWELKLPFVPFIGLEITPEDLGFEVQEVRFDPQTQSFVLSQEIDLAQLDPFGATLKEVEQSYRDDGWDVRK